MIFMAKKIAELGDHILFKNGIKGIVEKVNENSVIVNITENKTGLEFEGNRTVVAHKNYKVIHFA
ncbi:YkvS family protein [Neobacillus pocheonensis]|uniref:YkvS family protein n=1 Tax=Neobacillus pocheonensis TaxID=363869 RepID=A0ABT0WFV5_9BACI|nr:YkvS family protein [Neobacillus pocheonensis]